MILFEALGIPAIERQFGSTKLFLKSGMVRTIITINYLFII